MKKVVIYIMFREHFDDFHEVASGCEKKNPSENTIKLAKKYLLPNQNATNKVTVVVNTFRGEKITTERIIRFDEDKKEFYIFYNCSKYWVQPIREPLNKHDPALYKWKTY